MSPWHSQACLQITGQHDEAKTEQYPFVALHCCGGCSAGVLGGSCGARAGCIGHCACWRRQRGSSSCQGSSHRSNEGACMAFLVSSDEQPSMCRHGIVDMTCQTTSCECRQPLLVLEINLLPMVFVLGQSHGACKMTLDISILLPEDRTVCLTLKKYQRCSRHAQKE